MKAIDLGRQFRHLYYARKKVEEIEAPRGTYLSLAGQGAPAGDEYDAAIGAVYAVARLRNQGERTCSESVA